MTREEIKNDLKEINIVRHYPQPTCGCMHCRLMRHILDLLSECEMLEARIKELEDQKKFWKDTYTHNHMGTVRQIKEGKP